jgi:hypothetical protein
MFALMMGNSSVRSPTSRVRKDTSLREYTEDLRGTIRTSSNVNPFSTNFTPIKTSNLLVRLADAFLTADT